MASQHVVNAHNLAKVLLANGYDSRGKLLRSFDRRGRGSVGLKGIGPTLSTLLRTLLDPELTSKMEWEQLLPGIAWEGDTGSGEPGFSG